MASTVAKTLGSYAQAPGPPPWARIVDPPPPLPAWLPPNVQTQNSNPAVLRGG